MNYLVQRFQYLGLALLFFLCAASASAQYQTPTKVQSKTAFGNGGSVSATFTTQPATGNYVFVFVGAVYNLPLTSITASDNVSGTYTDVYAAQINGNTTLVTHHYSKIASTTASFAVTATLNGSGGTGEDIALVIEEWSGIALTSPLLASDNLPLGNSVSTSTNTTPSINPTCPSGGSCLYVAQIGTMCCGNTITHTGSGWTEDANFHSTAGSNDLNASVTHKLGTGSQADTWTFTTAYNASGIAAYAPAANVGGRKRVLVVTQ